MNQTGCDEEGKHIVHFTDEGRREKYTVKGKFRLGLLASTEPKLKEQPPCSENVSAMVYMRFWRGFNLTGEPDGFLSTGAILPISPELDRKFSVFDDTEPVTDIEGTIIPLIRGLDVSIRMTSFDLDSYTCTESGSLLKVSGGFQRSSPVISPEGVFERLNYFPDMFGGIYSVIRQDTGEELVESEEEYCQISIEREDGSTVWVRKVKGKCSEVEVQCENECPPGTCKCWQNKALKKYCCRKCRKVSLVPTNGTSGNNQEGGNSGGNNSD